MATEPLSNQDLIDRLSPRNAAEVYFSQLATIDPRPGRAELEYAFWAGYDAAVKAFLHVSLRLEGDDSAEVLHGILKIVDAGPNPDQSAAAE